ncbi:MAG: hypothetical protein RKP73_14060, partial [Candidatus Contendobacter sp.]|nr:hypothetical protein [Candidatus Contendobacter sp.]
VGGGRFGFLTHDEEFLQEEDFHESLTGSGSGFSNPGVDTFTSSLRKTTIFLPLFSGHPPKLRSINHGRARRCAMDDVFMLGFMLGFFLLMTFLIELCAWLVRRR